MEAIAKCNEDPKIIVMPRERPQVLHMGEKNTYELSLREDGSMVFKKKTVAAEQRKLPTRIIPKPTTTTKCFMIL